MDRRADAGAGKYSKEGSISAANTIVFIDCGHRADHPLEQLVCKRTFASCFLNAASICGKAALNFPDCAGSYKSTNDQGKKIPRTHRSRSLALDTLASMKDFLLFLARLVQHRIQFGADHLELGESFDRVTPQVLSDFDVTIHVRPKSLPTFIIEK